MPASFRVFTLLRDSKAHLAAVGESYFEHLRFALTVGAMLIAAGLACSLHAFVPAWCTGTASRTIRQLNALLSDRTLLARTAREAGNAIAFTLLLILSAVTAAFPWGAGADAAVAAPLSLIALALPLAFLLANPELAPDGEEPRP